ncbi:MAG: hypothetical protein ACP5JG_02290 [Anaerolineae bacterium]
MTEWLSSAEIDSVVREKLERGKRERITLTPRRKQHARGIAHRLLSLIF